MEENLTHWLILFWLLTSLLSFLNGLVRRLHVIQWLVISLLAGPLALLVSLLLTGHGYRQSIFRRSRVEEPRVKAPRIPTDDEILAGKIPFKAEVHDLKRSGKLDEAISMLEVLVEVVEEKARKLDRGVPHWYYEQLANIYKKKGKAKNERKVLERWARLRHAENPGAEKRLAQRLSRLKESSTRA